MDTYVQAMSDEKRKAQSKVVKVLLAGVRKGSAVKTDFLKVIDSFGVPYGNRTRVAAVKGRCPRPLDERDAW